MADHHDRHAVMVAARGASLAGAQKIAKLLKEGKNGQAQYLATGFTTFVNILTHGASQQQVVHVRPGFWVLACFFDTQDHGEHTQLGMERVIHITKQAAPPPQRTGSGPPRPGRALPAR